MGCLEQTLHTADAVNPHFSFISRCFAECTDTVVNLLLLTDLLISLWDALMC